VYTKCRLDPNIIFLFWGKRSLTKTWKSSASSSYDSFTDISINFDFLTPLIINNQEQNQLNIFAENNHANPTAFCSVSSTLNSLKGSFHNYFQYF